MKYLNLPPKYFPLNDGKNPIQKFLKLLIGILNLSYMVASIDNMHVVYGCPLPLNCIPTETSESVPIPSFNASFCSRIQSIILGDDKPEELVKLSLLSIQHCYPGLLSGIKLCMYSAWQRKRTFVLFLTLLFGTFCVCLLAANSNFINKGVV